MNRLQKKCLIATAGLHLLLVLVVLFGSAFFTRHEKPDDTTLLDVIPANLIDAALTSGVKNAQPPAPAPPQPPTPPQPVQQPLPPPPQPKPEPVKPAPTFVDKMEKIFEPTPKPDAEDPIEPKPQPHKIKVDKKLVTRTASKTPPDNSAAEEREAKRLRDQKAKAFRDAARSIEQKASSATTIEALPGTSSVSYAGYGSAIKSIYTHAWNPPTETASDDANTEVIVTIGNDGTVISARIINPSGDSQVDASVQRALDSVTSVPAFPDGATEKQKTFKIKFNLKAKRMLG